MYMYLAERPKAAQVRNNWSAAALTWSLSPTVVLIAQGKGKATVIPISAELQGRPEDYWLRNPVSIWAY